MARAVALVSSLRVAREDEPYSKGELQRLYASSSQGLEVCTVRHGIRFDMRHLEARIGCRHYPRGRSGSR